MKIEGYTEYGLATAANVPNNSIFRDVADGLMKMKDSSGVVAEMGGGGGKFLSQTVNSAYLSSNTRWGAKSATTTGGWKNVNNYDLYSGMPVLPATGATIGDSVLQSCTGEFTAPVAVTIDSFRLIQSRVTAGRNNPITAISIIKALMRIRANQMDIVDIGILYENQDITGLYNQSLTNPDNVLLDLDGSVDFTDNVVPKGYTVYVFILPFNASEYIHNFRHIFECSLT